MTTTVLQRQLESYEGSAAQVVGAHGGGGAGGGEVEDLIDVGLHLYEAIQRAARRWNQRNQRACPPGDKPDLEAARRFMHLYTRLGESFERIAQAVGAAEGRGQSIEGMERFAEARAELRALLGVPLERMAAAEEHYRAGRGRPLGEVRDELRRRAGA